MGMFDDDIRITRIGQGIFEGEISGNWSVNGNPNGGYLMAILAGAMTSDSDKKSTPIITANYITRCKPGKAEQKGRVRFRDGRGYDLQSIFLIADAIPPAIFVTQGPTAWVPTIELSINIRNMPVTEWLRFSLRTRFATCGLLEADGEVWDEAGNLVSISRQIAQVRKV